MCGGLPEEKRKWLGYKNGFEKAYDRTDWDILDFIMPQKRFGSKW